MRHVGRKLFHLLGGLGLLSLYYLLSRPNALISYGLIALAVLVFELIRLKYPALNRFIQRYAMGFIRMNEVNTFTGILPYVIGVGMSLFLYPTHIATAAILFLACGDVSATAIGERFGRMKIYRGKSLEGALAFVVVSVAVGLALNLTGSQVPIIVLCLGATTAASVELFLPRFLNDNLAIPVVAGGVMTLLVKIF